MEATTQKAFEGGSTIAIVLSSSTCQTGAVVKIRSAGSTCSVRVAFMRRGHARQRPTVEITRLPRTGIERSVVQGIIPRTAIMKHRLVSKPDCTAKHSSTAQQPLYWADLWHVAVTATYLNHGVPKYLLVIFILIISSVFLFLPPYGAPR